MKKLILVVFITLTFSIPCMAQGIEPDGLFGLNGTVWDPQMEIESPNFGFYAGEAYAVGFEGECGHGFPSSSYTDFLFFSVFQISWGDGVMEWNGLLSSLLGIGVATYHDTGETFMLKKVSDGFVAEDCLYSLE